MNDVIDRKPVLSRLAWVSLSLCLFAVPGQSSEGAVEAERPNARVAIVESVFDVMTGILPGKWRGAWADGTAENPTSDWTETTVEYEVTAGGSALIENFTDEQGRPYMTTVYHKDNNDLRATHFCGARNHPRMIARHVDLDRRVVEFDFVDVANLKSADSYHSRGLSLEIESDNEVVITFAGLQDGQGNTRVFKFRKETVQD